MKGFGSYQNYEMEEFMKNKRSIILIIAILITIGIIATVIIINKQNNKEKPLMDFATTSVEQRKLWNDFMNSEPYLSQVTTIPYVNETDLIKLAITSNNIEIERIVTEEIEKNELLSLGDGYKKSKNNINEYLKNLLGQEEIAYNFAETYVEEDNYLIIDEDYVYFTKIQLPEKVYIAVSYEENNNNYEVQIYEYDVTEQNRESLTKMLETGDINKEIEINNKYILTGQIENNNIKITSKTSF